MDVHLDALDPLGARSGEHRLEDLLRPRRRGVVNDEQTGGHPANLARSAATTPGWDRSGPRSEPDGIRLRWGQPLRVVRGWSP
ncbi:hypothetical protein IDVR_24540 [Intrasporangium sp. DVR]